MKRLRKQQILEQGIYGAIWIVIFLLPLIGGYFAVSSGLRQEEARVVMRESWLSILPFFMLFLLNNYGLVPYLFFRRKYRLYTVSLVFAIGMTCWFFPFLFSAPAVGFPTEAGREEMLSRAKENRRDRIIEMREREKRGREEGGARWERGKHQPPPFPYPPFVIRYLIHLIVAFLMVGFNIAIKLFFKSLRDEEMLKELEHRRLQSELQYLKYQLNPHFFMNTLNNIHALVDIDTGKAKSTLMELSKLMRYVLYEASNRTTLLSREIQFLENYVALMSLRYNMNKVSIEMDFPDGLPEVQVPPLLFISFVENAFKHGISYRNESFIRVLLERTEEDKLMFRCTNSKHESSDGQHHGIGLENIRKRLRLLFGNNYTLSISQEEHVYDVLLIIPLL